MKNISLFFLMLFFVFNINAQTNEVKPEGVKTEDNTDQTLVNTAPKTDAVEFGEVTGTLKYKIACTSGSDVRDISVITQTDNSVGVVYKKFDTVKTMAIAKSDPAYADQVAEKMKGNLEKSGFTCVKE